ncbi:hypothetical protein LH442_03985 [Laribacter hongkongensis]|uniref:toxin-antitoxin system YwqK family antitoxin n=1 Tax=Laribacter hongkongensis TaxID=168471 RepID=UPI001EFD7BA4|nr:hypothetical protein [Laribacter hongkongensis]MCG9055158.1 hypothetical protein [Laribacter hongkongensis]MCG9116706.1 hypothetical protein [Laribacter hongkongensis]
MNTLLKKLQLPLLSVCSVGLVACAKQVDCNSDDAKKDTVEILQSNLEQAAWYKDVKLAISNPPVLENIKTIAMDEQKKNAQCRGVYSFVYNQKPQQFDVDYNLTYLEDKKNAEVKVNVGNVKASFVALVISNPPIKNGEQKILDEKTGGVYQVLHWKDNFLEGMQETFNPENNALIHRFNAIAGKKTGVEQAWSPDGKQLLIDLNWIDGKPNGVEKQIRASDGKLLTDVVWKDGNATGFIYDKNTETITQYKDGNKNGTRKSFSPMAGGREYVRKVENFKNNELDGVTQEFDENGRVTNETRYVQGKMISSLDQQSNVDACVENWIAAFRKEAGEGAAVMHDQLSEWESWCKSGKHP